MLNPLYFRCAQCVTRGHVTLHVKRDSVPTVHCERVDCGGCGSRRVAHVACAATLSPDVFPSLYLLPFTHLARILSSMDDLRLYFFGKIND